MTVDEIRQFLACTTDRRTSSSRRPASRPRSCRPTVSTRVSPASPAAAAPPGPFRRSPAARRHRARHASKRTSFSACGRRRARSPSRFALALLNHVLGGGISCRGCSRRSGRIGASPTRSSPNGSASPIPACWSCRSARRRTMRTPSSTSSPPSSTSAQAGITADELARAKGHVAADLLLGLEDSGTGCHASASDCCSSTRCSRSGSARPDRGRHPRRGGELAAAVLGGRRGCRSSGQRVPESSPRSTSGAPAGELAVLNSMK